MRRSLLVFALLSLFATTALAEFEIGASIGRSDVETDANGLALKGDDLDWKVFLGWRFLRFFGVEGGYQSFGSPGVSLGTSSASVDVWGVDAFGVGVLPIKKFELFGKVGFIYYDWKSQARGVPGATPTEDKSGVDVAYGIGVAWRFTPRVAMRVEWERFDIEPANDLTSLSVGVDFRF